MLVGKDQSGSEGSKTSESAQRLSKDSANILQRPTEISSEVFRHDDFSAIFIISMIDF